MCLLSVALSPVLLCASPAPAAAQSSRSVEQKYVQAQSAYDAGEYDAALGLIEEGLARDPQHLDLLRLRGEVLFDKRQFEDALVAYQAYLDADPPRAPARKVRGIVDNLGICQTTAVKLSVTNGPAQVYLDSKSNGPWCTADPECKKGVLPGRYRIIIERSGFLPVRKRIRVRAGSTTELAGETLQEKPSSLTIEVTPADAEITLDGQVLGSSPQTQEALAAGEHRLEVSLAGFAPVDTTFSAHHGKPVRIELILTELLGVDLSVPDAELLLDGQPIDVEDGVIGLPHGRKAHTLTAKKTGYFDITIDVPADRPREHKVELVLKKKPKPKPGPVVQSPPRDTPGEWTAMKISTMVASGVAASLGYGVAAVEARNARSQWRQAEANCPQEPDAGGSCRTEGIPQVRDAQSAAHNAERALLVGTLATTGFLWALNRNEPGPSGHGMSLQRTLSIAAAAGLAAAGVALGTHYGLRAVSQRRRVEELCSDEFVCDSEGYLLESRAVSNAGVANVSFAAAGIASAGAVLLWLTAPAPGRESSDAPNRAAMHIGPRLGGDGIGVTIGGSF